MRLSRKCLSSYLIILFIVCIPLSLFVSSMVQILYGNQHEQCENVKFSIVDPKQRGTIITGTLSNKGNVSINLSVSDERETEIIVENAEDKSFVIYSDEPTLEFMPQITVDGKSYYCKEKKIKETFKK